MYERRMTSPFWGQATWNQTMVLCFAMCDLEQIVGLFCAFDSSLLQNEDINSHILPELLSELLISKQEKIRAM